MDALTEIIRDVLGSDGRQTVEQVADVLSEALQAAAAAVCGSLMNDGKVLCYGGGQAAVLAQCFAGYMVNGFEQERMPLAALALDADVDGGGAAAVRRIQALGKSGDILWLAALPGRDDADTAAVLEAAHEAGMQAVVFSGGDGGALPGLLAAQDVWLNVPDDHPARVLETQLLLIHALCAAVDAVLLDGVPL